LSGARCCSHQIVLRSAPVPFDLKLVWWCVNSSFGTDLHTPVVLRPPSPSEQLASQDDAPAGGQIWGVWLFQQAGPRRSDDSSRREQRKCLVGMFELTCLLGFIWRNERGETWLGKTPCGPPTRKRNAIILSLASFVPGAFLGRDLTSPTLENVIVNVVPLRKTHRSGSLQLGLASLARRSLRLPPFSLVHDNEADAQWSADNPVSVGRRQCTAFA